jgi:transcription antitermination protein NusB
MQRRKAREFVLRLLYQREFVDASLEESLADIEPGEQRLYIEQTFQGIVDHLAEVDALISEHAVGWRVERLAVIDRNILRLGLFELLHEPDIPAEVAMDEAVELSKKYGTEHAQVFINGILDRVWKSSSTRAMESPPRPG